MGGLVASSLVLCDHVSGDPATRGQLDAVGCGPRANCLGVHGAGVFGCGAAPTASAATDALSAVDVRRQNLLELLGVRLAEVDAVVRAVEAEREGLATLLDLGPVQIVDQDYLRALRHAYSFVVWIFGHPKCPLSTTIAAWGDDSTMLRLRTR